MWLGDLSGGILYEVYLFKQEETPPGFLFCYAFALPVKTGGYFQNVPLGHFVASNFIRLLSPTFS